MTQPSGKNLRFERVTKSFGSVNVLCDTDIEIKAGEFMTLLGPSGSGKSTLLNIAAGYLEPTSGSVFIGDRDVTNVPARHRQIGMVFQNYALFPHMTVEQNVAYGPTVQKVKKADIKRRVTEALATVQMQEFANRSIQALSGGQRQRVALARAIAVEPDVILMDEPLGALDRQLRKDVQLEIRRLHEKHGRTTIYVTHDQEEALVMSDRIAVMRDGKIVQVGAPKDLYSRPDSAFIASFLGESNLIEGVVTSRSDSHAVLRSDVLNQEFKAPCASGVAEGETAALVIRPEHVSVSSDSGLFAASLLEAVFLGEIEARRLALEDGTEFWSRRMAAELGAQSDKLWVNWSEERARIVPMT
ncbi:ABC transporter ATP-binding protein [Rhodobacteraceae bacterium]|nr:ABC transporter ATP-binding protein [Paracoccaceae bacterium]